MDNLSTSPPPGATEVRTWVLYTPDQLRTLRRGLGEEIDSEPLDDVPERMLLVATELATNAIRHGLPPTEVRLLRTDREFVLDVVDHDPDTPPEVSGEIPDMESYGGRGLQIARSLSLDVGWYTTERAKHVWALFPATAPADREPG